MPFSKPVVWRDRLFDSVLEADWAASLTAWGVRWVHHPGRIELSDGRGFEPDFLLSTAAAWGEDILLEVKGEHNERYDKIELAATDNPDQIILVGRSPISFTLNRSDRPAAQWHLPSGEEYEWDLNGRGRVYHSATSVDKNRTGLTFFRAVPNTRYIR